MLASDLLHTLEALIAKHGDLPVHVYNDEWQTSSPASTVTVEEPRDNKHRDLPDQPKRIEIT